MCVLLMEDRKGKHLNEMERGQIAALDKQGLSPYKIGKILGRAANTIRNELRRGTVKVIDGYFEKERYYPDAGQKVYEWNMRNCGCYGKKKKCTDFLAYVEEEVLNNKRSLDSIRGRALKEGLFCKEEMVCTTTLYTYVERGYLKIKNIDLVEKVGRKTRKENLDRRHKRLKGRSIEERPKVVDEREEFGHWEIDLVIGKREGGDQVLLTLTERKTKQEIIRKLSGKTVEAVERAIKKIKDSCPWFSEVFKSITSDNGSEFARLYELEERMGTKVYYAHPYSSFERGLNEGTNRIVRRFVPKGEKIARFSEEKIADIESWINTLPRRSLGYATAEEKFREELEEIKRKYA